MNKSDLINELNSLKNAKRVYRDKSASFVLKHPETFPFLLEIVFENSLKFSVKAAWVLELVCFENINLIAKYLNYFTNNITRITDESALRPLSKVCFFITNAYFLKNKNPIKNHLTNKNIDQIIENNFDWLIENHKIATQVFAMDTLYLFGKEYDWIHQELKLVLEKDTSTKSVGYQSHAKKVLKELK